MNITVIALGIVVIILVYFLFKMFYRSYTNIEKKYLKDGSSSIPYNKLKNPGSTRYNYSSWVYVNTWSNTNTKSLISRKSQIVPADGSKHSSTTPDFILWLDKTSPALKCLFAYNGATDVDSVMTPITITNNFPIQKWVYLIISVDNQIIDCYIDGKLTISSKLAKPARVSSSDVTLGDSNNPDIYLVSTKLESTPMDPQTAWTNYLMGNGMGNSNTNLKMSYIQDNIEKRYFTVPV